jgi:hypothetical protein
MNFNLCARAGRFAGPERLESRRVMAGNVNVELIEGSLFIEGDDAANGIAIVGTENPGEVRVIGTPAFFGDVTELNFQTEPLIFNVAHDIIIRTGAGNDGVELNKLDVGRNLTIETGDGLDRVKVGSSVGSFAVPTVAWPAAGENVPGGVLYDPARVAERALDPYGLWVLTPEYTPLDRLEGAVTVARALSIATGEDSDYVYLGRVRVTADIDLRTDVDVRTDDGNDIVIARDVAARGFDARTGYGGDLLNISGLTARGQLTLETGFGDDFISFAASHAQAATMFYGGHGDNQFYIATSVFSGSLYASFGIDRDRLVIKTSMLLGNTNIVTGAGSDRIDIDYCFGRFVGMVTGADNDLVSVRGSALDYIFAHLGDGDDQLWLTVSRILAPFYAEGGGGGNDLINDYGSYANFTGIPGFEHLSHGYPWWQTV